VCSFTNPRLLETLTNSNERKTKKLIVRLLIGPKGEPVSVKLFPQASGDYTGEFTPTKIGKQNEI